jgi:hypothetical protein
MTNHYEAAADRLAYKEWGFAGEAEAFTREIG